IPLDQPADHQCDIITAGAENVTNPDLGDDVIEVFGGEVWRVEPQASAKLNHAVDINADALLGRIARAAEEGECAGGVAGGALLNHGGDVVLTHEIGELQALDVIAARTVERDKGAIA